MRGLGRILGGVGGVDAMRLDGWCGVVKEGRYECKLYPWRRRNPSRLANVHGIAVEWADGPLVLLMQHARLWTLRILFLEYGLYGGYSTRRFIIIMERNYNSSAMKRLEHRASCDFLSTTTRYRKIQPVIRPPQPSLVPD